MVPAGPPNRQTRARPKSRTAIIVDIRVEVARFSCSSPVPTPEIEKRRAGCQLGSTARVSGARVAAVARFLPVRTPRFRVAGAGVAGSAGAGASTAGSAAGGGTSTRSAAGPAPVAGGVSAIAPPGSPVSCPDRAASCPGSSTVMP